MKIKFLLITSLVCFLFAQCKEGRQKVNNSSYGNIHLQNGGTLQSYIDKSKWILYQIDYKKHMALFTKNGLDTTFTKKGYEVSYQLYSIDFQQESNYTSCYFIIYYDGKEMLNKTAKTSVLFDENGNIINIGGGRIVYVESKKILASINDDYSQFSEFLIKNVSLLSDELKLLAKANGIRF